MSRPTLALLLVSVLWGTTFVAIKSGLDDASPLLFVGMRFGIAAVVAAVTLPHREALRDALPAAIPLGLVLAVGYASQTIGLQTTTPARSAFITGVNVAVVPVWGALLLRRRPQALTLAGLALAVPGLWLLTSPGSSSWTVGDGWTLLCAVAFALHVVLLNRWSPRHETSALLVGQLVVTATACLGASIALETPHVTFTRSLAVSLAVTALLATVGTTWLQLRFQPRVEATRAAVIYTTEPVFASLFSLWLYGERLPVLGWAGGALILAGALLSEVGAKRR